MAPTDGVDPTNGSSPPMSRGALAALTIGGALVAGAVGGLAAFGVAHTVSDDTTLAADATQTVQTTTAPPPVEDQIPAQPPSIVPSTVTTTATPTSGSEPTESGGTTTGSSGGGSVTSTVRGAGDSDESPEVLPERVLPSITTTPDAAEDEEPVVRQAGTEDVEDAGAESPSPSTTTVREGEEPESDDDEEGESRESGAEVTTTVPTDEGGDAEGGGPAPAPAPDNSLLSDRTDLTAQRIDGAFRNALAPGVPAERRDELFEGGAQARPLTDRLASLSTGSAPLLHWSVHEPVNREDDRATVRVRSDVLFNQAWRPVTFVNVDGQWKMTRESTCELSRSLLLPCT